ncbi:MAG: hypothetical protein PHQ35_05745 [Phycisphaerae bacterium]|nr:hypothetical protein [Phycisphaerae bacterium]
MADKIALSFAEGPVATNLVPPVSAKRSEDASLRKRFMLTFAGKFSKKYHRLGSVAQ